jgi:hypothetical protein
MKTKFLPKLLLFSLFCVALNSCTEDEILNYTQGEASSTSVTTSTTTMDATTTTTTTDPSEEVIITKPR